MGEAASFGWGMVSFKAALLIFLLASRRFPLPVLEILSELPAKPRSSFIPILGLEPRLSFFTLAGEDPPSPGLLGLFGELGKTSSPPRELGEGISTAAVELNWDRNAASEPDMEPFWIPESILLKC